MDIVIGTFYQTDFGIIRTCGSSRTTDDVIISWYKIKKTKGFRNFYEHGTTRVSRIRNWQRLYIDDFPESVDHALPYSFDLFFDIKRMSQLRRAFQYEDSRELLEMMKNHGIFFKKKS